MSDKAHGNKSKRGFVLMTVLMLTAAAALLAFGLMDQSVGQMKVTSGQESLEQALYVAEGGCQLCLAYIMAGSNVPASISGTIGEGTYSARINLGAGSSIQNYTLCSTGYVRGVHRVVTIDYVQSRSWAEYALWYDQGGTLTFEDGEEFWGRVHSNSKLYITSGDRPIFHKRVTSAASTWGSGPGVAQFDEGYELAVAAENMATINFTNTAQSMCLASNATITFTGRTDMAMSGTNIYITNPNRNWTKYNYGAANGSLLSNGLIYVDTVQSTNPGTLNIAGTLDGRLTVVAEGDINITNHIRYAVAPTNGSNDALGLISRQNVWVGGSCPADLDIYAHIIASGDATSATNDGKFEVSNYTARANSGDLNVYGGIVQNVRGAVGSGTHGYWKNYVFDTRFATNPPPYYPVVGDKYYWGGWRDGP